MKTKNVITTNIFKFTPSDETFEALQTNRERFEYAIKCFISHQLNNRNNEMIDYCILTKKTIADTIIFIIDETDVPTFDLRQKLAMCVEYSIYQSLCKSKKIDIITLINVLDDIL